MNGTSCLVFGTSFMDLGISGFNTDAAIRADNFSNGSGIRVNKADTIRMENLDIRRKQFGVHMGQTPGLEFAYDHVIDVWTANNLYLSFNQYGIWQTGWVSNVRLRNIFGCSLLCFSASLLLCSSLSALLSLLYVATYIV